MSTSELESKVASLQLPGLPKIFRLSNGDDIPTVGFGTFQGESDNSAVKRAVLVALNAGYRLIDTAYAYGNESQVGEAIRESGIPRDEIYVVTKLFVTNAAKQPLSFLEASGLFRSV
jgi:diketogulonate reductase-like aldo/keto reductase